MIKRKVHNKFLYLYSFLTLCSVTVQSQLHISYSPLAFSNASDISIIPGEDIPSSVESSENAIEISVCFLPNNMQNELHRNWHINIKKIDIEWLPQLQLSIMRTNNGQHIYNNQIIGGSDFTSIQNHDSLFFSGQGKIMNIACKIKLDGRSLILPVRQYQTEIIFTLLDD